MNTDENVRRAISERRYALEKARREHSRTVMTDYDKEHYRRMGVLREDCEQSTGHHFRFSHLGPLGHPWSYCAYCGASKVETPE